MWLEESRVGERFQRTVVSLDVFQVPLSCRTAGQLELLGRHPLLFVLDALATDTVGEPGQVKLGILFLYV